MIQKLIAYLLAGLEILIYVLDRLFTICIFLLSLGWVSTCLYYTSHRQQWGAVMTLVPYGCMVCIVLVFLEYILMHFTQAEDRTIFLNDRRATKWQKRLSLEGRILTIAFIASILISMLKLGSYVQTFTGDPWWATIHYAIFFTFPFFFLFRNLQEQFICEYILKEKV